MGKESTRLNSEELLLSRNEEPEDDLEKFLMPNHVFVFSFFWTFLLMMFYVQYKLDIALIFWLIASAKEPMQSDWCECVCGT